jgi:hypothetical protein
VKSLLDNDFQSLSGPRVKERGIYLQMTSNIFSSQPWHIHQVEYFFGANLCQTETICDDSVEAKIKIAEKLCD